MKWWVCKRVEILTTTIPWAWCLALVSSDAYACLKITTHVKWKTVRSLTNHTALLEQVYTWRKGISSLYLIVQHIHIKADSNREKSVLQPIRSSYLCRPEHAIEKSKEKTWRQGHPEVCAKSKQCMEHNPATKFAIKPELPRSHNWKRSNPQGTVVPDIMCSWKIQNLRQRL